MVITANYCHDMLEGKNHLILTFYSFNGVLVYRTVVLQRWVYDPRHGIDVKKHMKVPWLVFCIGRNKIKNQSYAQGVGRHTEEEVLQVMDEDLQALSKFLGIIILIYDVKL